MAGLGLNQAVDAYMVGVAGNERMRQINTQRKEAEGMAAADSAWSAVHQREQERMLRDNPTGAYQPTDSIEFEAAGARSAELARRGMWKQYLQNEAALTQQRMRVRGSALEAYKVDRDADKLIRTVYPTLSNGRKVVGTKRIDGADAVQGLEAIPEQIEVELDDGTKTVRPVHELVAELNKSLMDPARSAELEIKNNYEQALIRARGEQNRATEGMKIEGRKEVEKAKGDTRLEVENVKLGGRAEDRASRERIAETNAGARRYAADRGLDSAEARAGATTAAAETRAGATTAAAGIRAGAGGGGKAADPAKAFDTLHKEITKIAGDPSGGPFGGAKLSSEQTLRISRAAEAAIAAGVPRSQAMQEAIQAYKRHLDKQAKPK